MTKIIFNKSHKIIAAVMALVLCFSAFLWIAPQVQAEELDISDTSVTGFTAPGARTAIINDNLTGGSIGVFVTSTTGDRYRADNVKWTYNNGDWEFDGDSKVIFENNDEKQQIAAYYPYTETTNGSVAITLPEAYDANYDQYDYLYGEYDSLSSNPAIIRMEHLMAKVTVNVQDRGTGRQCEIHRACGRAPHSHVDPSGGYAQRVWRRRAHRSLRERKLIHRLRPANRG